MLGEGLYFFNSKYNNSREVFALGNIIQSESEPNKVFP